MDRDQLLACATEFTFEPNLGELGEFPGREAFIQRHVLHVRFRAGAWLIEKKNVPYSWNPRTGDWVLGTWLIGTLNQALAQLPYALTTYEAELIPWSRELLTRHLATLAVKS